MATIIGSINHYITASTKASTDIFASIFNLLDTQGDQIGVKRVAYNTGSGIDGLGMGYADALDEAYNNAWACFHFTSADTPFYLLMQFATSSTPSYPFGNSSSYGSLLGDDPYSAYGGVGIQFAAVPFSLEKETDIWKGSRGSNGRDIKNIPCNWSTSSNDLVVFPRSNNDEISLGNNPLSKSNFTPLITQKDLNVSDVMWHTLVDANTFIFMKNFGTSSADYAYSGMFFGKYTECVGFNSKMKYFLVNNVTKSINMPFEMLSSAIYYGNRYGTSSYDGGIAYPSCVSGCLSVCFDIPTFISSEQYSPSPFFSSASNAPIYDEFPLAVGAYDKYSNIYGFSGGCEFMRVVWGVDTHTVFSSSYRAAFGNSVSTSTKITIPWLSGSYYTPGSNLNRTGTLITFTSNY